jgi:predicted amidophosphoribosyltransferase
MGIRQVVRRYIHLSGKDVDNALLAINEEGQVKKEEYKLKSLKCIRCSETISPGMNFCSKCALPVNLNNEYTREMDLEQENKILKEKYERDVKTMRAEIKEEMKRQIAQLVTRIKPEIIREGVS